MLKKRVEGVLDMALTTISSLSESFISGVPVIAEDVGLSQNQDQIVSLDGVGSPGIPT